MSEYIFKINTKRKYFILLGVAFFIDGLLKMSMADSSVDIKITAQIVNPPCEINGNADFTINFDQLRVDEVNGKNGAITKKVPISCAYTTGTPYIKLTSSSVVTGHNNVLMTTGSNASSLGIALYQGNSVDENNPLIIGGGIGYELKKGFTNSEFTFTAVPYKYGSTSLVSGKYSASVTMDISYI